MKAIVNVNKSWGIGKDGNLLCNFKEDMEFFKTVTAGKIIICGLNTLLSFPKEKPLKGRVNIVIADDISKIPKTSINASDEYFIHTLKSMDDRDPLEEWIDVKVFNDNRTYLIGIDSLDYLEKTIDYIKDIRPFDEAYICGGASIYNQLIDRCESAFVTVNDCSDTADTFFPNLEEKDNWYLLIEGIHNTSKQRPEINYSINLWRNRKFDKYFTFDQIEALKRSEGSISGKQ